jgi:hypothetical protein
MKNQCVQKIPSEISARITSLRFLLIVLVVFIHNNFTQEQIEKDGIEILFNQNFLGKWIQLFISQGIARSAVPIFFLFSAYIFCVKNDSFAVSIKKRIRSLVVPFFLWSVLQIFVFSPIQVFLFNAIKIVLKNKIPFETLSEEIPFLSWTPADFFHGIFGYNISSAESLKSVLGGFAVQFWYVRDLFILFLLSPVLKNCIKKNPLAAMTVVSFFYFCDIRPVFVACHALFYFSLGIFCAEFKIDFFAIADKISWKISWTIFAFFFFVTNFFFDGNSPYKFFVWFCACILLLKFSRTICARPEFFSFAEKLSHYSFWLFAIHNPVLNGIFSRLFIKFFPMKNTFFCLLEYFGATFCVVIFGTILGVVLKKFCPKIFAILTGGR